MRTSVKLAICVIFSAGLFIEVAYVFELMLATVKMTNVVCESMNKSWVTFELCRLRAISRNKTVLNVEATFVHPANKIDIHLQLKKKANGYKPWLFNYRFDGCLYMRKQNHPGIKIFWDLFRDYSTVNHTCPYMGKQSVRNLWIDLRNMTLPVPSGDYLLLLTWIFDKKPQFVTNVYFTFYQDLLKD